MALHAAGVELTRKRLACPSCGEEMPVGLVSDSTGTAVENLGTTPESKSDGGRHE